jgi:hypothetical protein
MFAGQPPSSSDPTKRLRRRMGHVLDAFHRLLLQIGGANIAGTDRAEKPPTSSSFADEKRVGSLLLSTAARDPWTRRVVRLAAREAYRLALAVALGVGAALVA